MKTFITGIPSVPEFKIENISFTTATLSWEEVPGIDQYQLWVDDEIILIDRQDTEYTLRNLKPGKSYNVEILAINGKWKGPTSTLNIKTKGNKFS